MHCGRSLSGVRWVADVPDGLKPAPPRPPAAPYSGPPAYRDVPRWSLWPWAPTSGPDVPAVRERPPADELRLRAGLLGRLAASTAVLAVIAAVAELWRYGLLLASRSSALSPGPVAFSDTLVTLVGLLTPMAAVATGVVFLLWLVRARTMAAEHSGTVPSRSTRAVVVGSVLPGPNLTVPGAALAETEHAASGFPPGERPRPSAPVRAWWIAWAVSVVLGLLTVLRGLGTSTQAMADTVLLHAVTDVAAAVAAVLTIRVVDHLTELIAPELRATGRDQVLAVRP